MPGSVLSPRRSAIAGLLLIAVAVAVVVATVAHAVDRTHRAIRADLTVTATPTGAAIPSGFLGISTEVFTFEDYTGSDPNAIDPVFLRMLKDIGPGANHPILRIGGDSTDWTWLPQRGLTEPKGITYAISPRWLQVARATAQRINGKLILGVNLEGDERPVAVAEADAMARIIGRRYIEAIEIGNEPELYHHFALYHTASGAPVTGRPNSYTEQDYFAQFHSYASVMPRGIPLAGPVVGFGKWIDKLPQFLAAEPFVSLVTIHAYPLQHCGAGGNDLTIADVLAPSSDQGFLAEVRPYTDMARRAGKPMRIDEVNAISCGGTRGVSDSFGSALWMVNTLFGLAQTGVAGVNVHMVPHAINSILNPVGSGATPKAISAQPEYYAMMMFAQAAPAGARILHIDGSLAPSAQAWATRDSAGTIHVVLTNKSAGHDATITLRIPGARGPASVESLLAPSLAATEGVTLGGQTFGRATSTGELTGARQNEMISPRDGAYTVHVPKASALMLTLGPAS